ncbi:hypothetical protein pipiens_019201 [Culex pipiens pipiens]|uniref:Uncharacterized protein n=1 Tax=Culex pipiens pipiens TaxID=38569 RepID=A0ABD1DVP9_CULPP
MEISPAPKTGPVRSPPLAETRIMIRKVGRSQHKKTNPNRWQHSCNVDSLLYRGPEPHPLPENKAIVKAADKVTEATKKRDESKTAKKSETGKKAVTGDKKEKKIAKNDGVRCL